MEVDANSVPGLDSACQRRLVHSRQAQAADVVGRAVVERMIVADWLRTLRWEFWATVTWANPVSADPTLRYPGLGGYALACVDRWVLATGPSTYAVTALEVGPIGERVHAHALVGGLGRSPWIEVRLRRGWRHGNVQVVGYDPRRDRPGSCRGASWYLVKDGTEALHLIGTPRPYRPRKRGGRRERMRTT